LPKLNLLSPCLILATDRESTLAQRTETRSAGACGIVSLRLSHRAPTTHKQRQTEKRRARGDISECFYGCESVSLPTPPRCLFCVNGICPYVCVPTTIDHTRFMQNPGILLYESKLAEPLASTPCARHTPIRPVVEQGRFASLLTAPYQGERMCP